MAGQPKARTGCCHATELINNIFYAYRYVFSGRRVLSSGLQLGARVVNTFPDGDVRARTRAFRSCIGRVSFSSGRARARFERRRLNERFQRGRLEAEPIAGSQSERNWSHGLRFAINGIESTPASPASLRSSFGTTHDAETASVARRNGGRERRASGRRRKEGREDGEEARGWGGGWEASILGNGRAAK